MIKFYHALLVQRIPDCRVKSVPHPSKYNICIVHTLIMSLINHVVALPIDRGRVSPPCVPGVAVGGGKSETGIATTAKENGDFSKTTSVNMIF